MEKLFENSSSPSAGGRPTAPSDLTHRHRPLRQEAGPLGTRPFTAFALRGSPACHHRPPDCTAAPWRGSPQQRRPHPRCPQREYRLDRCRSEPADAPPTGTAHSGRMPARRESDPSTGVPRREGRPAGTPARQHICPARRPGLSPPSTRRHHRPPDGTAAPWSGRPRPPQHRWLRPRCQQRNSRLGQSRSAPAGAPPTDQLHLRHQPASTSRCCALCPPLSTAGPTHAALTGSTRPGSCPRLRARIGP